MWELEQKDLAQSRKQCNQFVIQLAKSGNLSWEHTQNLCKGETVYAEIGMINNMSEEPHLSVKLELV